jgi:hypothetical protein
LLYSCPAMPIAKLCCFSPALIAKYESFRQESAGNRWNMQGVSSPEVFRIFSDDFPPVSAKKHRKLSGIHWTKFKKAFG